MSVAIASHRRRISEVSPVAAGICSIGVHLAERLLMPRRDTLFIDRGDLPSAAAVALERDPGRLIFWHPVEPDRGAAARRSIVRARSLDFGEAPALIADLAVRLGQGEFAPPAGWFRSHLLFSAAVAAGELGCRRVVWPVAAGQNVDDAARECERIAVIEAALSIGADETEVLVFDLPLVDLPDDRVVDLAIDCGVSEKQFWPCDASSHQPCGRCLECLRWISAFDAFGADWPWKAQAATV